MKKRILTHGPTRAARPTTARRARQQNTAHVGARPSRPTACNGRDLRATTTCKKRPRTIRYLLRALRHYSSSLRFYNYTLPFLLLRRGDIPGTRARTGAMARAPSDHAGITRPSMSYLRGRRLPRRQRAATGGDTTNMGIVLGSLPGGDP